MPCQTLITISVPLALLPTFKTASPHRPSSRAGTIKTSSNTAYEMTAIPETSQEQYEPVDYDIDTVPPTINDAYGVTLHHLPASSGTRAEDEMIYVTAEDNEAGAENEMIYVTAEDDEAGAEDEMIYVTAEDDEAGAEDEIIYVTAEDDEAGAEDEMIYI